MRKYHSEEPVPWKEITDILYWHLEVQVCHIRHQLERGDLRAAWLLFPRLRTACESTASLRRFLGLPGMTKWEREAAELLKEETQER